MQKQIAHEDRNIEIAAWAPAHGVQELLTSYIWPWDMLRTFYISREVLLLGTRRVVKEQRNKQKILSRLLDIGKRGKTPLFPRAMMEK